MINALKILLDNIIEKNTVYFEYDFGYQKDVENILPKNWDLEYYFNALDNIHNEIEKAYKEFAYTKETDEEYISEWYINYKNKHFTVGYMNAYGGEDFYLKINDNFNNEKEILIG